jgi:hypothetical protein
MDTATYAPAVTTPAVDFDTRLTLASAGMDAILAHNHGVTLADAHAAVLAAREAPELLDPEPQPFTPHPVLKAAGDVIRARGWIKNSYGGLTGPVCAMAAIRTVLYGDNWSDLATNDGEVGPVDELLDRIAAEVGHRDWSVPMWNDAQSHELAVLKLLY